jgi:hypothetical protein
MQHLKRFWTRGVKKGVNAKENGKEKSPQTAWLWAFIYGSPCWTRTKKTMFLGVSKYSKYAYLKAFLQ